MRDITVRSDCGGGGGAVEHELKPSQQTNKPQASTGISSIAWLLCVQPTTKRRMKAAIYYCGGNTP